MSKLLKILGAVFLVFIIIGVIAVATDDKKAKASTGITTTAEPVAAVEDPATKVSASQLAATYEGNEVNADNLYKGKKVVVSGIVTKIAKDVMDNPYVLLGTGKEFAVTEVQCMFEKDNSLASLTQGQKVSIEGTVDGKMMNVLVKDCVLK